MSFAFVTVPPSFLSVMRYDDLRVTALVAAIMIYGLGGTPTPDAVGAIEVVVALLLIFAVGPAGLHAVFFAKKPPLYHRAGQILLFYALSFPVGQSLAHGHSLAWAVRDVIPFFFMLLPLFLTDLVVKKAVYRRVVIGAVLFAGLSFSVRAFLPVLGWAVPDFSVAYIDHVDPYYLVNAPTVLLAGLFFLGMAGTQLYRAVSGLSFLKAGLFFILSIVPFLAMMWVMQRASLGLSVLAVVFWLGAAFVKAPVRALVPLAVVLCAGVFLSAWGGEIFLLLQEKTILVGVNSRWRELMAVLDAIDQGVLTALFGQGWGAGLSSPAVAGLYVNFTHSLFSSYALKTGLIGVFLVGFYLGSIGAGLWSLLFRNMILAGALAAPFVIDVLFYASFKSLDFGLLLLLIAVLHRRADSAR